MVIVPTTAARPPGRRASPPTNPLLAGLLPAPWFPAGCDRACKSSMPSSGRKASGSVPPTSSSRHDFDLNLLQALALLGRQAPLAESPAGRP